MKIVSISRGLPLFLKILAITLITNLVSINIANANNIPSNDGEATITLTLLSGSKLNGVVKGKTQTSIYLLVDNDIIILSKDMLSPESWNVAYEAKVWGVPETKPVATLGKKSPTIASNIPKRVKSSDSSQFYVSSSFEPKESKDQVPIIIEK
jgi:hypothetical protein